MDQDSGPISRDPLPGRGLLLSDASAERTSYPLVRALTAYGIPMTSTCIRALDRRAALLPAGRERVTVVEVDEAGSANA